MSLFLRTPRGIALAVAVLVLVAGVVAILVTGASSAYLGTLLVGCTALGTILATMLDRRVAGR